MPKYSAKDLLHMPQKDHPIQVNTYGKMAANQNRGKRIHQDE